ILDEPEEIRAAADRFWKRLEDPERPALCPPEKVFYQWEDLGQRNPAQIELRELEIASPFTDRRGDAATGRHGENQAAFPIPQPPSPIPPLFHIALPPPLPSPGNIEGALPGARGLVEAGRGGEFFAAALVQREGFSGIFNECG